MGRLVLAVKLPGLCILPASRCLRGYPCLLPLPRLRVAGLFTVQIALCAYSKAVASKREVERLPWLPGAGFDPVTGGVWRKRYG